MSRSRMLLSGARRTREEPVTGLATRRTRRRQDLGQAADVGIESRRARERGRRRGRRGVVGYAAEPAAVEVPECGDSCGRRVILQ